MQKVLLSRKNQHMHMHDDCHFTLKTQYCSTQLAWPVHVALVQNYIADATDTYVLILFNCNMSRAIKPHVLACKEL